MTTYVIAIIIIALVFDYINGFHDAANSIATVVSTRVLSPRSAVLWAAAFNFIAFALFEPTVARNIAKGVEPAFITPNVILGGLARRDPLEPAHLVVGAAVVVLARAHGRASPGAAVKSAGRPSVLDATVFGKTAAFILVAPLAGRRASGSC